jgi:hypothetical protein
MSPRMEKNPAGIASIVRSANGSGRWYGWPFRLGLVGIARPLEKPHPRRPIASSCSQADRFRSLGHNGAPLSLVRFQMGWRKSPDRPVATHDGGSDYAQARAAGVNRIIDNIGTYGYWNYNYTPKQALRLIESFHRFAESHNGQMGIALSADGVIPYSVRRTGSASSCIRTTRTSSTSARSDVVGRLPDCKDPLLGFTHAWGKSRNGKDVVRQTTAKSRFARSPAAVKDWCRANRHRPAPE